MDKSKGENVLPLKKAKNKVVKDKRMCKRQQEKCEIKAGKATVVQEVVSGSLPAAKRTQFLDILKQNHGKKVYIENSHTLARSTVAGALSHSRTSTAMRILSEVQQQG